VITLDEITGTGATMIDINGYSNVNNVMVATCVGFNLQHAYGQTDMTSTTLFNTLKTIIAWIEAHGCRCYIMRFDPSGQARSRLTKEAMNDLGVHVDITSAKVKNEAAMAEGSNAIYNQAVRSNLLNVLITSDAEGGRDKKWRHKLAYLAGRFALHCGNCLHNSGSNKVPMAEWKQRPIDLEKMFPGPFGCVCIFRDHAAGNKTENRGQIGIYGGFVHSATLTRIKSL